MSRLLLPLVALLAVTACAGPVSQSRSAATAPAPDPLVYVAVGASETVGVGAADPAREAWPRVLRDRELPDATFVNVGVSGATVRAALDRQVAEALAAEPDVVTVWLAVNDLATLVPVADYERQLQRLVGLLRREGRTEVLVGNVPDLWRLPAYRACLPGAGRGDVPCGLPAVPAQGQVRAVVADFNAAIERVALAEGARLVDLSGEDDLTGLTANDGFHPSSRGHREVAEAFARALRG